MIDSDREGYVFSMQEEGLEPVVLGSGTNAGLSTEGTKTMTFTGTMMAMFAEQGKGIFYNFHMEVRPDKVGFTG